MKILIQKLKRPYEKSGLRLPPFGMITINGIDIWNAAAEEHIYVQELKYRKKKKKVKIGTR